MGRLLTNKNPSCVFYRDDESISAILVGGKKYKNIEDAKIFFKINYLKICTDEGIHEYASHIYFNHEPEIKKVGFDKEEGRYFLLGICDSEKKYVQECWYFKVTGLIYK